MKKIKSPYYGIIWVMIWTAALGWFLQSGMFNERESVGLLVVWAILVGTTVYVIYRYVKVHGWESPQPKTVRKTGTATLNAPCPCGSGKKYKRCCGA